MPIYNDNQGCVDWCKSMTTKGMKHVSLRENAVRKSVDNKELSIHHVSGKLNPADLFTKELKDGAHFYRLRDILCHLERVFSLASVKVENMFHL